MLKPYFFIFPVLLFLCSQVKTFAQSNSPFATLDSIHHVCDSMGGYVRFSLNGDPDSYNYYWLHGPVSLELDSLLPGEYTLVVIDYYGCIEIYEVTIEDMNGCYMTWQILQTRVECIAEIVIRVYSSATGLPINESALSVEWSDENPAGLTRTISLKEDSLYCVQIKSLGSEDSCCLIDTCIFVPANPKCKFIIQNHRLIVNEINRRSNGDGQYAELLVVGNGECGDSADIRGFRLDDNNGYLIPGNSFVNAFNPGAIGVNPGFLAFSFSSTWAAVPNGSLILVYDEEGRKEAGFPEDDPADSNQDGVYVLPANSSAHFLGFTSNWNESNSQWVYSGSIQPPSWDLIEISPNADGMQTRYPDGYFDHGQSLGETPFSAPNSFDVWITDVSSLSCNCQFIKNDPLDKDDFICTSAEEELQTPGLPNSQENASHIDSLRNCQRSLLVYDPPAGKILEDKGKLRQEKQEREDEAIAFPNPYDRKIFLKVNSPISGPAYLRAFSAAGQLLALQTISFEAGEQVVEIAALENLAPGLHILQICFPSGNTKHLRLVKVE